MNTETNDDEKLEDYAVDVRELREVHEQLVATKGAIEALVVEERQLGPVDSMTDAQKEELRKTVEDKLERWEEAKLAEGFKGHPDTPFNRLAQEHFDLEQEILDAEDEQVEEATEHPFDKPLR
jgi:hypothetical protein